MLSERLVSSIRGVAAPLKDIAGVITRRRKHCSREKVAAADDFSAKEVGDDKGNDSGRWSRQFRYPAYISCTEVIRSLSTARVHEMAFSYWMR